MLILLKENSMGYSYYTYPDIRKSKNIYSNEVRSEINSGGNMNSSGLRSWCLTPLSTLLKFYCGG